MGIPCCHRRGRHRRLAAQVVRDHRASLVRRLIRTDGTVVYSRLEAPVRATRHAEVARLRSRRRKGDQALGGGRHGVWHAMLLQKTDSEVALPHCRHERRAAMLWVHHDPLSAATRRVGCRAEAVHAARCTGAVQARPRHTRVNGRHERQGGLV